MAAPAKKSTTKKAAAVKAAPAKKAAKAPAKAAKATVAPVKKAVAKASAAGRRPRGELTAAVLKAVTKAKQPVTPAEVRESLGEELAYTTVMTVLVRLHAKGAVRRERRGRAYAYAPAD